MLQKCGLITTFLFVVSQQLVSSYSEGDLDALKYEGNLLKIAEVIQRDPVLRAEWENNARIIDQKELELPPPPEFKCDLGVKSETSPTSVHELRPGDISVLAALGDSITAGNGLGARTLLEVAVANRGEVFSIGGDRTLEEGVVTLPNIFRKYNPTLKGYSICATSEENVFRSWFNVAKPGNTNDDMLDQATVLVTRIQDDPKVNFTQDWKLVTMFVGGNDLCGSCTGRHSADDYYMWFERAIQHFSDNMPRTVVNLVSMFDVTPLQNMSTGLACDLLQWGFCHCGRNWTTLPGLRELQLNYSAKLELLASDPRFNREDFTVVHQPHMRDLVPPMNPNTGEYILGFLSPDCFHPTRIAHQGFAVWLWNTLFTPVGHKPTTVDSNNLNVQIACPTKERPYIFTRENSVGVEWPPPELPTENPPLTGSPAIFYNVYTLYTLTAIGYFLRYFVAETQLLYNE